MQESTKGDLKIIGQRVVGGSAGATLGITGGRALGSRVEHAIVRGVKSGIRKAVKNVTGHSVPAKALNKIKPGGRIPRLAGAVYGTVGGVTGFSKAPEVVEAVKSYARRKGMKKESGFSKLAGFITANEDETGKQYGKRMLATAAIAAAVGTGAGAYALRRGVASRAAGVAKRDRQSIQRLKRRVSAIDVPRKKMKNSNIGKEIGEALRGISKNLKGQSKAIRGAGKRFKDINTKDKVRKALKSKKTLVL